MSLQSVTRLNIDFCNKKYISINAKQYDRKSRFLLFACYNCGEFVPVYPGKHSAYVRYKKSDEYSVFNFCEITNDNKILVELTEQMLSVEGICYADLVIVNKGSAKVDAKTGEIVVIDDSGILSTMTFCIDVGTPVVDNIEIESSYEYNGLNNTLEMANAEYSNVIRMAKSYTNGDAGGIRENENTDNALYYYKKCLANANSSSANADNAEQYMNKAKTYMNNANTYMTNAKSSETKATTSATNAKTSEQNALTSEFNAKSSETNAKSSETNAKSSETNAKTYMNNAATSVINAKSSEDKALASELNAKSSEVNAKSSEDNAKTYMNNANTYMGNAKTSETNAITSETNAQKYMNNAQSSEDNAKAYMDNALLYMNNAQSSEDNALSYMNNAQFSEHNAKTYMDNTIDNYMLSKSYVVGGTGTRDNEDYDNAQYYYGLIRDIVAGLECGFIPQGTVSFSELAGVEKATGYVYNISDDFVTDESFREGAGKSYTAGVNVYFTANGQWDCFGGTSSPTATVDEVKSYLGI